MSTNWFLIGTVTLMTPVLIRGFDKPEQMDIFNDDSVKLDFHDTNIIDNELMPGTQEQLKAKAMKYVGDTCF